MPNRNRASTIEAKLSIHPIPASNASRLARLRTHLKLPWYFALSYVWGTGSALKKTRMIILDGCEFKVTENVYHALRENRSFASWPLRLWIDSICINQEDSNEKDGQISIMREIYHLASVVLVSLGSGVDEDLRMMQFISKLTQPPLMNRMVAWFMDLYATTEEEEKRGRTESWLEWARAMVIWKGYAWLMSGIMVAVWPFLTLFEVSMNISRDDQEFKIWPNTAPKFNIEEAIHGLEGWAPSAECYEATKDEDLGEMARLLEKNLLLESQYFNRMWTLQEGVTALTVSIQRSGLQIDLGNVIKTIYYLNTKQNKTKFDQSTIETLTTLWIIERAWARGIRLSLRELLFHCRHRNCYDSKDMVYALLGLINGRMDPRLQPNKNKSVGEVYADATRFIADSEHCLDVICCVGWNDRPDDLPTWSPHFRRFGISDKVTPLIDASSRTNIFSASLKEPYLNCDSVTTTGYSNRTLKVTGLYVGTVQNISQKTTSEEDINLVERKWNTALTTSNKLAWKQLKMISSLSELLRLYGEVDNAIDKERIWTERNDQINSLAANVVKPDTRDHVVSYLLTLVCGRTSPTTRCNVNEIMSLLEGASVQDEAGKATLTTLRGALKDGMSGRRLVVLEEGPLGAVPVDAEVGDAIFVLIGCNVPVCL